MSKVPSYISELVPYTPGKSIEELLRETGQKEIIKLASNENPLGPSPKAVAAIKRVLEKINYYPDDGFALRKKLAHKLRVKPENILLSNGSDSIMLAIVRAFVTEGGEVVTSEWSFTQFTLMPASRGALIKQVPMKNYRYDLETIAKKITPQTQVVFLANPNNPTGTMFTKKEWEGFYEGIPKDTLIVCDEAYAEFVFENQSWPNSLEYRYDNVITLRTFSKAYGLAGLRLGYCVASPKILKELYKVKLPFEPSTLALAAGEAALDDEGFVQEYVALVRKGREYFYERLGAMGISYLPSAANFVMVDFKTEAALQKVFETLLEEGIIIRPLQAFGLPHCARISIGLPSQNEKCMEVIKQCGKF